MDSPRTEEVHQSVTSTSNLSPINPVTPNHGHAQKRNRSRRTANPHNGPENSHNNSKFKRTVIVKGYPRYTQIQELGLVFSKFGDVMVERVNNNYAILVYNTEAEANLAIKASKKVNVNGEFLTVNFQTPSDLKQRHMIQKRDFPMSKQKGQAIDPTKIELSGDFHSQMDKILTAVRLTQEEVQALSKLYSDVEEVLQELWPGCKATPFGSITTGLGVKSSDADCFIDIPVHLKHPNENYVSKAHRILRQKPDLFAEILAIPRANTPIVKLFHKPTETNCDLTFKTLLGSRNSKLISFLLKSDPRLLPLAVIIKYWAKVHDLSGTGKLTNYALTMLFIFYLQQLDRPILPSVKSLQEDPTSTFMVDFWNTGFMADRKGMPPCHNTLSLSALLGGFFEYYSTFNFDEMIVCPFLGRPMKKTDFKNIAELPEAFGIYKNNVMQGISMPLKLTTSICVQDPFEHSHNIASAITGRLAADLKIYFKFAAHVYEKFKQGNTRDFFKLILIQKPKLVNQKQHQKFRVMIFPKLKASIMESEWKSVVKEIIFKIFENILKLPLGKDEKLNPNPKKEKYTVHVTKAIWKRKQFSRLYNFMKFEFLERESRVTDEIMKLDSTQTNFQFQLLVSYRQIPKSATLLLKFIAGDMEGFREFSKFLISTMQSWFMCLLKSYSKLSDKNATVNMQDIVQTVDESGPVVDDEDDDDSDDDLIIENKHDVSSDKELEMDVKNNLKVSQ